MVNMSSKFVYDDDASRNCPSSSPPSNPGPSEPRRPQLDEAPGNARNKPGPGPASEQISGLASRPAFGPAFGPASETIFGPGSGPTSEQISGPPSGPASVPVSGSTVRPPSEPVSGATFRPTAVVPGYRGCRFSSLLNSHGVRYECTSDRDEDCCYRCWLGNYSMRGWTLDSILEEVSQSGPNNQQVGSNRRANASRAGSLANKGFVGKPEDCSVGHDQLVAPDEPTARSMVDCISEAFRMIERLYQRLVCALCIVVVLFICAVVFVVLISKM